MSDGGEPFRAVPLDSLRQALSDHRFDCFDNDLAAIWLKVAVCSCGAHLGEAFVSEETAFDVWLEHLVSVLEAGGSVRLALTTKPTT